MKKLSSLRFATNAACSRWALIKPSNTRMEPAIVSNTSRATANIDELKYPAMRSRGLCLLKPLGEE